METRKISLCIPYYNRANLILEVLEYPLTDERISEILIVDDRSSQGDFNELLKLTAEFKKVRIVRNAVNHHVQHSKHNAISFASNDFCIILDNDNIISKDFVDKIYAIEDWQKDTIYHPAFASPNFDYRLLNGTTITKENVASFCHHNFFVTLLNTNNYFCNRDEYIKHYLYEPSCRGGDGIFTAIRWFSAGNKYLIVSELTYDHRISENSEFLREVDSNMKLIYHYLETVKTLK